MRPHAYWPIETLHGYVNSNEYDGPQPNINSWEDMPTIPHKDRAKMTDVDPETIFSLAEWSMYIDVVQWLLLGVPGLPWANASIDKLVGDAFNVRAFVLDKDGVKHDIFCVKLALERTA